MAQLQIQPRAFGDQIALFVNDANHARADGAAPQQANSDGLVGHSDERYRLVALSNRQTLTTDRSFFTRCDQWTNPAKRLGFEKHVATDAAHLGGNVVNHDDATPMANRVRHLCALIFSGASID
jgi:hypothetical protein